MSAPVSIRLLGGFRLSVAGRSVTSLPRKALALLAYIACQDGRPVTRESVSDLLWTTRGVEQARHSLRQALLVLRREVPEAIGNDPRMLAFVPGVVESDIGRFRLLSRSTDRAELAEAAETYGGPLLDRLPLVSGDFDDWLRSARDNLTDQAIEVMRRLVDACLTAGDMHPAVLAAERMLALDLLREDSHRKLMEVYLRAGRRADAIRQYDACVEVLRRELDVGPSEETEGLGAEIRTADLAPVEHSRPRLAAGIHLWDGPPRIAVLPFDQPSDRTLPEHITEGLVEDIVCQLAGLRELSVISYGTTRRFRNASHTINDIGRATDARYVVRGSIRRSGRSVRISTELTEVDTSRVLWAQTHDTIDAPSFEDQDRIVGEVIHSLTPRVQETEIVRIRGKRIDDLSVYEKVLLARDLLNRLGSENFLAAKRIMDEVIDHDPNWGEAYAVAADCHGLLLAEGWSRDRDHHVSEIERLSAIALNLDHANVRALTFYAHRRTIFHRDFDAAVDLFRRALDAAPGSAQAWLWSSITYSHMGLGDEAVSRAERALRLSPVDNQAYWFYLALCMAHYAKRQFDTAAEWGLKALSEPSTGRTGPRRVVAALAGAGRLREARDLAKRLLSDDSSIKVTAIVAGSTFREGERRDEYGRHLAAAGIPE